MDVRKVDSEGNENWLVRVPYLKDDEGNLHSFTDDMVGNTLKLTLCEGLRWWHRLYFWFIYPITRRGLRTSDCRLEEDANGDIVGVYTIVLVVDSDIIVVAGDD